MAFVNIPKDLSKVKNKIAFNLSPRQLICFGIAAIIGIPVYIFTRISIGNTAAVLLMMGLMLPPFFVGIYEKDGQPAEKVLRNYIRAHLYWPRVRPYKVDNFYDILEKEGKTLANKTAKKAKPTTIRKRQTGKAKPSRRKKNGK